MIAGAQAARLGAACRAAVRCFGVPDETRVGTITPC